jgi:hypothetical protein
MKLRIILAATVATTALAAPAASAQTQPIDGSTVVGGTVPSMLELVLTQPPTATFSTFTKAKTYTTSFNAAVTATDDTTFLSLADGDATSGSKLGHFVSGKKALPSPLTASVKGAFQPLDTTLDPQLAHWTDAVTRGAATVKLRQKVTGKSKGPYHKVLLVTLSSETP